MLNTDQPTPCSTSGDPEMWFRKRDQKKAKALCQTCPQLLECMRQTQETEALLGCRLEGVHGGMTKAEREGIESVRRIA